MDNSKCVRDILESFDEITTEQELTNGKFMISAFGKLFLFIAPLEDVPASMPHIFLFNDPGLDIPHIMLREYSSSDLGELPEGSYRSICLYESESNVNTIIPYEDKVIDALDRLVALFSMSKIQKEREYQKEFMFYWNNHSVDKLRLSVYLQHDTTFAEMDAYYGKREIRAIERGLDLTDLNSRTNNERNWVQHIENDIFFIPIIDCREIIPPNRGYDWSEEDIKEILYSQQIEHISSETFQRIKTCIPRRKDVILIFGMKSELADVVFAVRLRCKKASGRTLLEKVLNEIVAVEPLHTIRKDYLHLCSLIGNDIGVIGKKVLLVGAGSLGSYVAFELVKNGISRLTIYDGDNLEEENVLRWAYGGVGKGVNKAAHLSLLLSLIHPEVIIKAIDKDIEEEALINEIADVDIIVFTIGNSDDQLIFNRVLKEAQCSVPVLYVWLEAGGEYSHILVTDYQKKGCFECLYTDVDGKLINNRARKNPDGYSDAAMIRNGCGGTRAAYGTATILRTVAALLDTLKNIQSNKIEGSVLIDISPDKVCFSDTAFPMEGCSCCGIKAV